MINQTTSTSSSLGVFPFTDIDLFVNVTLESGSHIISLRAVATLPALSVTRRMAEYIPGPGSENVGYVVL